MSRLSHTELHKVSRAGWLRASVLGANDGLVSTAALIVGVAEATPDKHAVLIAGIAGLVAGAMSMAAGEYVSVSSQADAEAADIARETGELRDQRASEEDELTHIYVERGVEPKLAREVALQMMAKDALGAHARDELGITEITKARPIQAAMASAATFTVGAAAPMLVVVLSPQSAITLTVSASSLVFLAILGALGAKTGGAIVWKGVVRVTFWGAAALALTAGIGHLFGAAVG